MASLRSQQLSARVIEARIETKKIKEVDCNGISGVTQEHNGAMRCTTALRAAESSVYPPQAGRAFTRMSGHISTDWSVYAWRFAVRDKSSQSSISP